MILRRLLVCFLFLSYPLIPQEQATKQDNVGDFTMTLFLETDNPIVESYEIEFWKEVPNQKTKEFPIQKFAQTGRNVIDVMPGYHFFRVRSIAKLNIRGYWTDFNPIRRYPLQKEITRNSPFEAQKKLISSDVFLKLENQNGISENFLTSKEIQFKMDSKPDTKYFYRLNQNIWQRAIGNKISIQSEGNYFLEYYAEDILGNRENIQGLEFSLDFTAPVSVIQVIGDTSSETENLYVSPLSYLKIVSSDNYVGVKDIFYRTGCEISETTKWLKYVEQISIRSLVEKKCNQKVILEFYAVDKLENKENLQRIDIKITKQYE